MIKTAIRRAALSVVALLAVGSLPATAADSRPNILLVVADDMGWTDIGSFGSEIDTPNLDALAARGVKFTDYHVSMSCSPTRSMLLSGTDNHIAGLGNMGELLTPEQKGKPGYEGYLNRRVASLAEVLKGNGYHTYMAGKWHLGHEPGQYPGDRGFERAFSMLYGAASFWPDMIGPLPAEPVAKYTMNGKELKELPGDFYATRSYTDFLIESIREQRGDGKPFLAYLAFTTPHDPMHVPEPWLSRYEGRYSEGYEELKRQRVASARRLGVAPDGVPVPEHFERTPAWKSLSKEQRAVEARGMEAYAGMVSNMDYHYGRIESFLRDIGELDNTIVIFMSDNGPNPWASEDYPGMEGSEFFARFDNSLDNIGHPNSHYAYGMGWSEASSGPFNLFKLTMGEGGMRSPMLIDGPGIKGSRQVDAFTYIWDIMPTILDYAGIEHSERFEGRRVEPMRGKSLKPVLAGSRQTVYSDTDFVGGDLGGAGRWMRQGHMKIVWNRGGDHGFGTGQWELYDLEKDPGETRNLADSQPDKLAELVAAWDRYADEVGIVR